MRLSLMKDDRLKANQALLLFNQKYLSRFTLKQFPWRLHTLIIVGYFT